MLKIPRNRWKCWCIPDVKLWGDFKRNRQLLRSIVLTLMLWKRPNPTWRIASVSALSSTCWLTAGCSPEGIRVIPRERYVSYLWPQISDNWKIRRFLFIPDLKYSYWIPFLFLPDPNLLRYCWLFQRFQISLWVDHLVQNYLYRVWKYRGGAE